MTKSFKFALSVFALLSLSLTGCGGGSGGDKPSPDKPIFGTTDKASKEITLDGSQKKEAADNHYFTTQLTKTLNGQQHFISSKSQAVVESGSTSNIFAHSVKIGSSFGVTVLDETNRDFTSIVSDDGTITAPEVTEETELRVYLFATTRNTTVKHALKLTVVPKGSLATGEYFDFSSLGDAERTKMAASTEKFLLEQGLAPLTFCDTGGYQLYSSRLHSPFLDENKFIAGYGFGISDYGTISSPMDKEQTEAFKMFYHDQVDAAQEIGDFNYLASNSAAVDTFYSYISQQWFRTLVNKDATGYEYTNGLSRKNAPEAVNPDKNGASDTWKVYLRVGGSTNDASKGVVKGLNYRTASKQFAQFDKTPIKLEDYLTSFKILATQSIGYYRGSEQAGENTLNRQIKGFSNFYNETKDATTLPSDEEFMKKVGVKIDPKDNSITIQFNGKITPDYAEYQLNGVWANPTSEEFLKALGNGNVIEGAKKMGKSGQGVTPLDTMLSVGPYYTSYYESKKTVAFAKNEEWPLTKDEHGRDLYGIKGYHLNINTALQTNKNATIELFEQGLTDSSDIPSDYWSKYLTSPLKKKVPGSGYFPVYFVNTFDKHAHEQLFPASEWEVKPILANDDFYKGLVVGVDRNAIAEYFHRNPSYGIQEPVNKVSPKSPTAYNDSEAHKKVISDVFGTALDDFSLWKDNAADFFEVAIQEELDAGHYTLGTAENPTVITFELASLDDPTRKYTDGVVFQNWEEAFALAVSSHLNEEQKNDWVGENGKPLIKLDVTADAISASSDDTTLQKTILNEGVKAGNYDGQTVYRVTGNGLDAFNNFDKYKSDDSSGFTLNFGADTGVISKHMVYGGKYWSFNSLWGAGNGGIFVDELGGEKQFYSYDLSAAEVKKVGNNISVTFPCTIDKACKNVKVLADEVDFTTGIEAYKEVKHTWNSNGTLTIEFAGNAIIPGAALGDKYKPFTYLDFQITFDVMAGDQVITRSFGDYLLLETASLK